MPTIEKKRPTVSWQPNYYALAGVFYAGVVSLLILVPLNLQWIYERSNPPNLQQSEGGYILANCVVVFGMIFFICEQISLLHVWTEKDFVVQNRIIFQKKFDMRTLSTVKVHRHHIKLIFTVGKLELHRSYFKKFDDWITYIEFYKPHETWE